MSKQQQKNLLGKEVYKPLTPKQKEVLSYLAAGYQNKEIAFHMGLSLSTVKIHLIGLYTRLNVKTRIEAVVKARKLNLIPAVSA